MALTVAGLVLDLLARDGIDTAFGIPGVHNLAFWDAEGPERPRIIGVRHEQTAGYAADGLYRATGRTGAALLTTGPGAANVLTAFGEATTASSPMLVIASEIASSLRHPDGPRGVLHDMGDQSAMFAAFGGSTRSAASAQDAVVHTVLALRDLASPAARPVYTGVASDVLGQPWTGATPRPAPANQQLVDPHRVDDIAELIAASPRIVLWLGGGVVASGVEDQVRDLAHRTGAVVVTSFAGRGLLADDPHLLDAPVHEPEVGALVAEADLLLVLGSSFDAMNTKNWRLPVPRRRAAISLGEEIARTIEWDALLQSDLAIAMPLLHEALEARGVAPRQPWAPHVGAIRGEMFARLRSDPRVVPALDLLAAVHYGWAPADPIVCDMAVAGFWVGLYGRHMHPRRSQYPVGWGTLGYALPAAIGPASQGLPTLVVCGDGGPMFALGELATYAQESLPITVLIVDDGGYGMLRFDQQVLGHRERGVDLLTPDWVQLAASFGITGEACADVQRLPEALRRAAVANRQGEPRIIVWKQRLMPPRTTSPRWFEDA